jgi:hypothetical protein
LFLIFLVSTFVQSKKTSFEFLFNFGICLI